MESAAADSIVGGGPLAGPLHPSPADPFASMLKGAVILAFAAVLTAGILRIQARVSRLDDFQVDLSRARVEAPLWLPATEVAALKERAAPGGSAPLMRGGLPEFVAGRLETDPRVVKVLGARRIHPDAVEVVVQLRRPVALVESGGRLAAVDGKGIHVPGDYRTLALPRIRGAHGEIPPAGSPFGPDVRAGASVAAAIPRDLSSSLALAVLDVSGAGGQEGVVLRPGAAPGLGTASIEGGRAPSSGDAALDPSPDAKVARLRLAVERFPGLRGLKTVRLGFDELVVVPL